MRTVISLPICHWMSNETKLQASDAEKSEIELTDDAYFDCWQLNVSAAPLLVTVSKIGWSNVVDATLQEEVCTKSALVVGVSTIPDEGDMVRFWP